MAWRDRIKEFRRIPVEKLRPNPKNPAVHDDEQREAMRGALAELGYIDALIAREGEDGMFDLVDGHLRADLSPGQKVPVLIVELTDSEADAALASHDPVGRMADLDPAAYAHLLGEIDALDADFRRFLQNEMPVGVSPNEGGGNGAEQGSRGPAEMELRPHEHYDHVIVLARTTQEWNRLCELLNLGITSRGRGSFKRMGIGRGIKASTLIELLENGNVSNRGAKQTSGKKRKENDRASA